MKFLNQRLSIWRGTFLYFIENDLVILIDSFVNEEIFKGFELCHKLFDSFFLIVGQQS